MPEKSTCTLYTVIVFGHFIIDNGYICIILQGLFFLAYICSKIAFCSIKPSCYLLLDKKKYSHANFKVKVRVCWK